MDRYYFITALPALEGLGSVAPMGGAELMEHLGADTRRGRLVATLLLFDDLLQRESFVSGELGEVEPAVLSMQQTRNEAPLPEWRALFSEQASGFVEADKLWEAYFRHADAVGRAENCSFLVRWVGFEVSLRNALARQRAQRLELDERRYVVAADLADESVDLTAVVQEWAAASTPLMGLRTVIRARWAWLDQHAAWFSFSEEELTVYAARLMLLEQWRRSSGQQELAAAESPGA